MLRSVSDSSRRHNDAGSTLWHFVATTATGDVLLASEFETTNDDARRHAMTVCASLAERHGPGVVVHGVIDARLVFSVTARKA